MFHLKDNFRPNAPISQVPASWFNAVAAFLNNLVGGFGIKMDKRSAFPSISVDMDALMDVLDKQKAEDKPKAEGEPVELLKCVEMTPSENPDGDKEWKRGDVELDESGKPVLNDDGETFPVGATFMVVSRVVSVGGVAYRLHLREMELDSIGRIKSISKEKGYFEIVSL